MNMTTGLQEIDVARSRDGELGDEIEAFLAAVRELTKVHEKGLISTEEYHRAVECLRCPVPEQPSQDSLWY